MEKMSIFVEKKASMANMRTVTIIGSGNVGTNLAMCPIWSDASSGYQVTQIASRTKEHAHALAEKLGARACSYGEVEDGADFYIYCVKDDALASVIAQVPARTGIHLHTAGSVSMDVFGGKRSQYGVLYPMQTFSKSRMVDWRQVPIFVETSSKEIRQEVLDLANAMSAHVQELDGEGRRTLHLAAVLCCNFMNALCADAADLLREHGIKFEVMLPLIEETVAKLHALSPREAQTGPAVRGDKNVEKMQREKLLKSRTLHEPETLEKIYELLSNRIWNNRLQRN